MKDKPKKIKIELEVDEDYVGVLMSALDVYSRLLIGQTEIIVATYWVNRARFDYDCIKVRELCEKMKSAAFPELSSTASYGILEKETPVSAKLAYELRRVIEHDYTWLSEPEGGHTVDFLEATKVSGDEYEMPKVKVEYLEKGKVKGDV